MKRASDRGSVLAAFNVSRETAAKLDAFVHELERWQAIKNLVGPSTLQQVWTRHIADSLQLHAHMPSAGPVLDLGSGGGFPGLVLATVRQEVMLGNMTLVESNGRKCAFLRQVIRINRLDASVQEQRIEAYMGKPEAVDRRFAYVTARALAPLRELLEWTSPLLKAGAVGIFPKGQDVELELKDAATSWDFDADIQHSQTDRAGRILIVRMS